MPLHRPTTSPPDPVLVQAILAEWQPLAVERVPTGVSTWVYRVTMPQGTCYLRILPEDDASFAPEVALHQTLRSQGVQVPAVLHWAERHPAVERSLMLLAELPGAALAEHPAPAELPQILAAAGRDLALVNALPVAGFGWIARRPGAAAGLGAPFATLPDWLADELGEPLQGLASAAHWAASVPIVQHATSELVERVGNAPACLVHGDLDLTHIFADGDTYSGLLDFGEIRGAYRCYDFGHFALEAPALLPLVLAGYRERQKLPNDAERQIALTALLIAARRVGRRLWLGRTPSASMTEALQRWSNLVGGHDD